MPDKSIVILRINAKNQAKIQHALEELKKVKAGELKDAKAEEIGFGIKIIKAGFLVKEKDPMAVEKLVQEISALKSVGNAEVIGMTLL